jgi:hypothetical protein
MLQHARLEERPNRPTYELDSDHYQDSGHERLRDDIRH